MNAKDPRADHGDADAPRATERLSDIAHEVKETLTGDAKDAPGEKPPEEQARKGEEPVDNLE